MRRLQLLQAAGVALAQQLLQDAAHLPVLTRLPPLLVRLQLLCLLQHIDRQCNFAVGDERHMAASRHRPRPRLRLRPPHLPLQLLRLLLEA